MAEFLDRSLPPTAELPQHLRVDVGEGDGGEGDATPRDEYTYHTTPSSLQSSPCPYSTRSTTTPSSNSKDSTHRHLNGRRFHGSAYYLPNDDLEAARLDLQHYTWKLSLNGHLSIAPVDLTTTQRILDIGTGTGIWCIEIAKAHPGVEVIGTDLSAIQPATKPGNCKFLQADAEEEWVFHDDDKGKGKGKFDFIHSRMLTMGMHDWRRYFAQCWENLRPGGWLQTGETQFPQRRAEEEEDDQSPSALLQWGRYCYDAAAQAGINARASEGFEDLLRAQGFVNISKYELQWPIGTWAVGRKAKVIGRLTLENMGKAVPGIGTGLLGGKLGWSGEEVDMERGRYYVPMVIHVAQKPFEE